MLTKRDYAKGHARLFVDIELYSNLKYYCDKHYGILLKRLLQLIKLETIVMSPLPYRSRTSSLIRKLNDSHIDKKAIQKARRADLVNQRLKGL